MTEGDIREAVCSKVSSKEATTYYQINFFFLPQRVLKNVKLYCTYKRILASRPKHSLLNYFEPIKQISGNTNIVSTNCDLHLMLLLN